MRNALSPVAFESKVDDFFWTDCQKECISLHTLEFELLSFVLLIVIFYKFFLLIKYLDPFIIYQVRDSPENH